MRRAVVVTLLVLAAGGAQPAAAAPQSVTIENVAFTPASVTITAGETVTWTNKDSIAHTVTSDPDGSAFDTSPTCDAAHTQDESCLKPDAPVTLTFDTPGTFAYHCKIHASMHGTVVVKGATTTSSATTSTSTTTTAPTTTQTTTTSAPTTSTASTTTTSSSTTSTSTTSTSTTTTTSTTVFSSGSGQVAISDKGGGGGGSSNAPLLVGAALLVAGLAGLAYWLWWRSGLPYEDDAPWIDEPPPTAQGPQV